MGIGLLVSGLTAYGFLVISARALGPERYAPLSILWTLVFLAAPGFFLPLEQELGRRLADSRAAGAADPSIMRRMSRAAIVLITGLVIVTLLAGFQILDHLLDDQILLWIALVISFVTYGSAYLIRGALSGYGRFDHYGLIVGGEGIVRFGACALLAYIGVSSAGPYGLAVALAPLVALAALPVRSTTAMNYVADGRRLRSALAYLLISSVLAQALINAGPVAVKLLATKAESAEAGRFLVGLVMARVPLFLFQAVQAALLPKLAHLAGSGRREEFRQALERILFVVAAIGLTATAGAYWLGPWALSILFGSEFALGGRDLALLAAASALCMAVIAFTQALIALSGHAQVAWGWLTGVVVFVLVTAVGGDLLLRVEMGLLAGATAAALVMGGLTALRLIRVTKAAAPRVLAAEYAQTS